VGRKKIGVGISCEDYNIGVHLLKIRMTLNGPSASYFWQS